MAGGRFSRILLLGPVMRGRNFISIMLVAFFFLIYILAGGQVTSVSKVQPSNVGFGSVAGAPPAPIAPDPLETDPAVTGLPNSEYELNRRNEVGVPNASFSTEPASNDGLVGRSTQEDMELGDRRGGREIESVEEYESDAMANIRERLKNLERQRSGN